MVSYIFFNDNKGMFDLRIFDGKCKEKKIEKNCKTRENLKFFEK